VWVVLNKAILISHPEQHQHQRCRVNFFFFTPIISLPFLNKASQRPPEKRALQQS
jgi:hypothetical protein